MKEDIARLQAQIVAMQQDLTTTGSSLSTDSSRKTASINANIERLNVEIQRLKGEVDTLRVGVVTGRLPGTSADNPDSIASMLQTIAERLEVVEKNQESVMAAIKKAGKSKKRGASNSTKQRKPVKSLRGLQESFGKKQYLYVVEDAKPIIKRNSGNSKHEAQYMYAESLYKLGRLRPAALAFNDYLDLNPKSYLAHAKLRLGDCFRHLGDKATARLYYEELLAKHAKSEEARLAKERLEKL